MSCLLIKNRGKSQLRIMLEPIGDCFDLNPGEEALISQSRKWEDPLTIDYFSDDFVSIWTSGKINVEIGNKKLNFTGI